MELPWTPIYSRPADGLQHEGYCNEFYPNGPTTYARFIWTVRMLTRNGFVVLIDNHLNSDPTVTQNPAQWLQVSPSSAQAPPCSRPAVCFAMFKSCQHPENPVCAWLALGCWCEWGCAQYAPHTCLHRAVIPALLPCSQVLHSVSVGSPRPGAPLRATLLSPRAAL